MVSLLAEGSGILLFDAEELEHHPLSSNIFLTSLRSGSVSVFLENLSVLDVILSAS